MYVHPATLELIMYNEDAIISSSLLKNIVGGLITGLYYNNALCIDTCAVVGIL